MKKVSGIAGSLLTLALGIFALRPEEWLQRITEWYRLASTFGAQLDLHSLALGSSLGIVVGAGISMAWATILRRKAEGLASSVIDSAIFEQRFIKAIRSGTYRTIKIFGYTGETVPDYFKYSLRYLEGAEIRILNRSWLAEADDEMTHNEKIKATRLRPWNKSNSIRHNAFQPWTYKITRDVRYYTSHPFVKGIILESPDRREAFVTFYEWQDLPIDGGSEFKGDSLPFIHLLGRTPDEVRLLVQLNSQFELLWHRKAETRESLTADEHRNTSLAKPAVTGPPVIATTPATKLANG